MKRFLKTAALALVLLCAVTLMMSLTVSATDVYEGVLPFDKELYYGRATLSGKENGELLVEVYDIVFDMVEKGTAERILNTKRSVDDIVITVDDMNTVLSAYRYDNPQHFWLDKFRMNVYTSDQTVYNLMITYLTEVNTAEAKGAFKAAAEAFIVDAGVTEGMSDYHTALLLYDAVTEHITYTSDTYNAHDAYGALIQGMAVCEGYAEMYQYLLYLCGISSHEVVGTASGEGHAWNLVKLDGKYYMADPTWDDQSYSSHSYFNVTTAELLDEGRTFAELGYDIPVCTDTEASYYNYHFYNMNNFKVEPSLENAITQLKYRGEARFHYVGDGEYTYDDFSEWVIANHGKIAGSFGLNGYSVRRAKEGCEFILSITGITTQPLPVVPNIPKLTAVCVDTVLTAVAESTVGPIVVCPLPLGGSYAPSDIHSLANNTAFRFSGMKNGAVVTGSEIIYDGEKASVAVTGDVDGDGDVTVFDAMMIKKAQTSQDEKDRFTTDKALQKLAADADGSSTATDDDARIILGHVIGKSGTN